MIQALGELVDTFSGEAGRTHCFKHVINLIAKSIIRQFDIPKTKKEKALDEAAQELVALAGNLDDEEHMTMEGLEVGDDNDTEDDNIDGWVDKLVEMSETEQEELDKDVWPVRRMLVKVCQPHSLVFYFHMSNELH
jgi:hypothetical protein